MFVVYDNTKNDTSNPQGPDPKPEPQDQIFLTPYMEKFLNDFEKKLAEDKDQDAPAIKVSEVLGGLARIYERVRTTVDYKGEHVIRRNAIERILKRLIWEQNSIRNRIDEAKIARSLVKELIWARYIPNNSVPKSKIALLEKVLRKYTYFLSNLDNVSGLRPANIRNWMWGIASSEIEDLLDPSYRELYVELMKDWFLSFYEWTDIEIDPKDKESQIYLSIHRAFTKSDEPIMRYHLLLKQFPQWADPTPRDLNELVLNFPQVYEKIENALNYDGRFNLFRRIKGLSASFEIFKEIANQEKLHLRELLQNPEAFNQKVREICVFKYNQIGKRVNTGITRSIIYIFVTKVILAMLLEIPYEIFRFGEIRYLPLSINILLPPIMMFAIGMSIKIPGAKNTENIVAKLNTVAYNTPAKTKQVFTVSNAERDKRLSNIFGFIYIVLFVLVFGGLTYLMTLLDFSILGMGIFFMFLSLVMLFAYRIRFNASQLRIEPDRENFINHIFNYLTLPFLNLGFYLSKGLSKINFLSILLDFLIEAPLKSVIEIFEEWTSFMKEKREEVVEVPD
jgi:hypothetical protein